MSDLPTVDFYFDVSSFQAFLASKVVTRWQRNNLANINWKPVDLAQLRRLSKSPIPDGKSEFSGMTEPKQVWAIRKLIWQASKLNVNYIRLPDRFLYTPATNAMAALINLSQLDNEEMLSNQASILFDARWTSKDEMDINDSTVISKLLSIDESNLPSSSLIDTTKLRHQTEIACKRCEIFTVPMMVLDNREVFAGVERLDMLENILIDYKKGRMKKKKISSDCPSVIHARLPLSFQQDLMVNTTDTSTDPLRNKNEVEVFVDFASPFAFLGYCKLYELSAYANIKITPVLIGAIFRSTGGPMLPAGSKSNMERVYGSMDIRRLFETNNLKFQFSNHFPLRSVTALRIALIEPLSIDCLFRGTWQKDLNISKDEVLIDLLNGYGFNGEALVKQAKTDKSIKQKLMDNTQRAISYGVFGLPSYIVNGDYQNMVWGQDRLDFVKAICLGWKPPSCLEINQINVRSKL